MKKVFLLLLVAVTSGVFAQSSSKEDLDIIQGIYGKSKKELAVAYMAIPEAKAVAFWAIYDAFEAERKVLGKTKVSIIEDYVANFNSLDDVKADKIAVASLKNNADYEKLFSKYYGQYKKTVGAIVAAKIIQFEVFMQTAVRSEIQEALPVLGDLEEVQQ